MVTDFTKEDIPVLGRLVSISEDNTIANAEQIWDDANKQHLSDTIHYINADIALLKEQRVAFDFFER